MKLLFKSRPSAIRVCCKTALLLVTSIPCIFALVQILWTSANPTARWYQPEKCRGLLLFINRENHTTSQLKKRKVACDFSGNGNALDGVAKMVSPVFAGPFQWYNFALAAIIFILLVGSACMLFYFYQEY